MTGSVGRYCAKGGAATDHLVMLMGSDDASSRQIQIREQIFGRAFPDSPKEKRGGPGFLRKVRSGSLLW
jgi:hypothetical protein